MIRFMADTWRDAMLRPLAMAAPNGWVYTEIVAPDFRFVLALALAVIVLITAFTRKSKNRGGKTVFSLLGLIFLSFVPWMATTGNGRYFMPHLILVGPLCVGLINLVTCTRGMKAIIALLVLGLQGFAVYQNNPWKPFDTWVAIPWRESPYVSVEIDQSAIEPETTYITVAGQTLSLVAPLFPPESRWVNLSVFNGSDVSKGSIVYDPVTKILETSKFLKIFQRSSPRAMVPNSDQPNQWAIDDMNSYLKPHRLALVEPTDCKLLAAKSLVRTAVTVTGETEMEKARIREKAGFWICSLVYPVTTPFVGKSTAEQAEAHEVFKKIESLCPRFFAPGQTLVSKSQTGYGRAYANSDSSLILTFNGHVYVQNARALNPERIGLAGDIMMKGYELDCTKFKGRSGLPWEREI